MRSDGCAPTYDGDNCSDHQLRRNSDDIYEGHAHRRPVSAQSSRRTLHDSVTTDPPAADRCSTDSFCTPHSIDDILRRPRREVYHASLALPAEPPRPTSGHVGRLEYTWSMAPDEVRCRDDDVELTSWKSMYDWSQRHHITTDARSPARLTAAGATTRPGRSIKPHALTVAAPALKPQTATVHSARTRTHWRRQLWGTGACAPFDFQLVILGITRFTDSGESCARFSAQ